MEQPPLLSPGTNQDAGTAPDEWEDPVTRLPGRAFWTRILGAEDAHGWRYRRPATVVLAEVVGLDRLAELWGEDVSAQVMPALAAILRSGSRASDYLASLGENRLAMILTETDEITAINVVERLRKRCDRELLGAPEGVWVAFGWASPSAMESLTAAADEAESRLAAELAAGRESVPKNRRRR